MHQYGTCCEKITRDRQFRDNLGLLQVGDTLQDCAYTVQKSWKLTKVCETDYFDTTWDTIFFCENDKELDNIQKIYDNCKCVESYNIVPVLYTRFMSSLK